MKNDKLIPGLILVMIGTIFLLDNFGYINFHWSNFFHLWPIFLVIGGVNLVFANNSSPWATILKIAVVVAGFALLLFGNFGNRSRWWWPRYSYHNNNDNDDNDNDDNDDEDSSSNKNGIVKVEGNSIFNEPFVAASARVARLNIDGGATTYNLRDTTNQLFSANTHEFFGRYQLNHHQEDSVYVVDFSMKDHNNGHFTWGNHDKSNSADIKLNINPEWEIHINAGATEVNFDLSKFKVRELKVNGGAGSFNLKVGQPLAVTNINISAGMAGAHVDIPKDAACRITTSTAFSSNDFDGFIKEGDGSYETAGYMNARNKININLSGGFSGFEVKRY